jgi:hypothetical protein
MLNVRIRIHRGSLRNFGAWFFLPIDLAEVLLASFVLAAVAIGIYWVCTGGWENVVIFMLLVTILGFIRVGIEKVSDKLHSG